MQKMWDGEENEGTSPLPLFKIFSNLEISTYQLGGHPEFNWIIEEWWMTICLAKHDPNFQDIMEVTMYLLQYFQKSKCAWHFECLKWEAYKVIQKVMCEWQEFKIIVV